MPPLLPRHLSQQTCILLSLTLGLALALACTHAAEQPATRPNIVIMIADDMDWQSLGCMGDPNARTPNLDKLAAQGLLLTRAFAPASVCAPYRAALATGMYPVRSGSYFNHPACLVRPGTPTLPEQLVKAGYRVATSGKVDLGPVESYPFELISYDKSALNQNGIREFLTRDPKQPYCFMYGSRRPHGPWKGKIADNVAPTDPQKLILPPTAVDTPETRKAIAGYYDAVTLLDQECGQLMDLVEQYGAPENTITFFTTEQGREIPWGKSDVVDDGVKNTLIWRWPGQIQPGTRNNAMVEIIDLLPTLLEIAGVENPPAMDGKSMLPVLKGATHHKEAVFAASSYLTRRSVRTDQFIYIRTYNHEATYVYTPNRPGSYHNVWWKEWQIKAVENPSVAALIQRYENRPPEELYAVTDERMDYPHLKNLVEDPAYADTLADMRARLDAWMENQKDVGIETDKEIKKLQTSMKKAGLKQHTFTNANDKEKE